MRDQEMDRLMKIIAHRGASLARQENSLSSLAYAASLGADAVECDVRITRDNVPVIQHDPDIRRLTGQPGQIAEMSCANLADRLRAAGHTLLTLDELLTAESVRADLLLHLKITPLPDFLLERLRAAAGRLICGIQTLADLDQVRSFVPGDRILAFTGHWDEIPAYIAGGAGIIRLWENWLDEIQPDTVRAMAPVSVWIMSNRNGTMNGSPESLQRFVELGADGVLLNDIEMALEWRQKRKEKTN
ncbi:MAG: glycerophosphodiester phosphodiesterase [Bacillota bacterium]|nr:glycerophosphodiester phosphodiesterase [Bacillota bacterium]